MIPETCKMISLALVGVSILSTISAESVNWRDTGSSYKVNDLRVSSCNRISCTLLKGGEYIMEIDFIATFPAKNLFFKISGTKYGITLPLLDGNLCDITDGNIVVGKCPVAEGDRVSYKHSFKVPDLIPAISGTVNGLVYDEDKVLLKGSVDITVSKVNKDSSPSKFGLFKGFSFFKNFGFATTTEST